jgi:hypothetical protein
MKTNVWIPGKFSLTNHMLSNLRAAGRWNGAVRPKGWVDMFAQETKAIRLAAAVAVRRSDINSKRSWHEAWDVWSLTFGVFGHGKHDPDAWYLLGKAVCDGFADAGAILQDRSDVWETGGRVLQGIWEEEWWLREVAGADANIIAVPRGEVDEVPGKAGPGVLVTMVDFERPAHHGL